MHDEANTSSPSTRHRLDTGSAARTPGAGGGQPSLSPMRERAENGVGTAREISRAMSERVDGVGRPVTDRVDGLSFSEALQHLRSGAKVARDGWNGKGQYIECQFPDLNSKMTRPYIVIHTVDGQLVPWVASQSDLLGFDWCLVREVTALVYGHGGRPETER